MSVIDAAREYITRGWSVVPVWHKGKNPIGNAWQKLRISKTELPNHFGKGEPVNIGVLLGEASAWLIDIDLDCPEAIELAANHLPPTWTFGHAPTSPRSHWLFVAIGAVHTPFTWRGGKLLEIRAVGHTVFPPSTHVSGEPVDWTAEDVALMPAPLAIDASELRVAAMALAVASMERQGATPEDVAAFHAKYSPRPRVPTVPRPLQSVARCARTTPYGQRALDGETHDLATMPEGGRNNALNKAAFRIGQLVPHAIDEEDARARLFDAACSCGLVADDGENGARATIASGLTKGMDSPRYPPERVDPFNGDPIECYPVAEVALTTTTTTHDNPQQDILDRVVALGGLCESFPKWCLETSHYPQPGLTIGALLALGSVMGGRRLRYGRATSSLYVCSIAETGAGKGRPQECVNTLLASHWSQLSGPMDLSSTMSTIHRIEGACAAGHGLLFVLDEYGPRLKALLDTRGGGHQKDLRALLLGLATNGTNDYRASQSLANGGKDKVLQAPALCLFGSSTHVALHDAIGTMSMDDGFLGRHIFFEGLPRLPQRARANDADFIPLEIVGAVEAIKENHDAWFASLPRIGNTADGKEIPIYRPVDMVDDGARELLDAFVIECDNRRRDPDGEDAQIAPLLARAAEHANRVALVLALLSRPHCEAPAVEADHARAAIAILRASVGVIARSVAGHAAGSDHERDRLKVLAAVRRVTGPDGWVRQRDVLRFCRSVRAKDIADILQRLASEGELETRHTTSKDNGGGAKITLIRLAVAGE